MLWVLCGGAVLAQTAAPPAVLVADEIIVTPDRRLIASGSVEAFQGQTRMTAQAIEYNAETETLTITGPITIDSGDGIVILASQAELSRDLQNGLLTGARLVLNEQLQLAAVQMNRVGGRYTQLYKTAATSCRVCEDDPRPPLWQIRAKRVVHDELERQLYFDEALLYWRNIPIFYLPRLRMPDPSLDRANGFLFPEIRSSTLLGTGAKVPYFIKLGDHRDLTLTPYLSNKTKTLEFRYRQAFRRGRIAFEGALSRDDLQPDDQRGYLFGVGEFDLGRDFRLQFDVEVISDDAYLADYGYSGKDRLDSEVRVSRARRDEYIRLSYINVKTLRDDENDDFLPSDIVEALYERRFFPIATGGEFRIAATARTHLRQSSNPGDTDGDGVADGRDVTRLNLEADWMRTGFVGGLQVTSQLGFAADAFDIKEDAAFDGSDSEISPRASVTLRYPMVRRDAGGVTQVIEPMVQLAWVGGNGLDIPNDESTFVEFDEGNLLTLSRFPAPDRRERGWSAAIGATWARFDPDGWSANLTIGQILREEAQVDITRSSGLGGLQSDYLLAGQLKFDGGLAITGRGLFDDQFDVAKAEFRGSWRNDRLDLGSSYVWLDEDIDEDRPDPISELSFDGSYKIDRFWTADLDWRYDLTEGRAATARAGIAYSNECVRVAASVTRRFADSTTVEPSTNLGFTVSLRGFATEAGGQSQVRSCGKQAK
ncbi:LPS assembly protein LptD [uncultured Tateyamaria sp.]|uniref:LPS-assembly protein LptD n=1 Tax=Tateyamaria sp. 1078 TaxID=3417464 RepID=UPI00261F2D53|nr:LPS assembly protein LptD [uncultured Tateyamaria sp.]